VADNYKYKAFISYSHADEKWASWLHKALETYRVPKHLVGQPTEFGPVPDRLAPVFRDREELASSTNLGDTLTEALRGSACQVVICSPRAAKSHWTNEEIVTFKRLGRAHRIFALIVDGEPGASGNPDTADQECFPPALIYELGPDKKLSDVRTEPIAADARPGKDPKQAAKLKLIAGMLGVGYDDLAQRDAHRRHRRMVAFSAAASIGMLVTSGLAVTAYLARIEAEQQRNQAQLEAEKARQTTQVFVDLFRMSDPSEARGHTITVREVFDKGAQRIDIELADQPDVQATLLDTIGTVYTSLGLYDEAVPLVRKAAEQRQLLYGAEHPDVAQSLNHLGEVQTLRAEFDEAEANLRAALDVRRNVLGNDAPETADTLTQLSRVLTGRGEYAEAEPLIREALAIRRQAFGDRTPESARSLEDLGLNLFDQGNIEGALPLLEDSVAILRESYGDLHPDLAKAINNLGFVLESNGNLEEAETLYKESLAMKREMLEDGHPEIAAGINNVAYVLYTQGDYAAAEPMYRELIDMERARLGYAHPEVAASMSTLAYLLYDKGDRPGALRIARDALAIRRAALGSKHPDIASSLNTIAMWATEEGSLVEAESMLRESVVMNTELLGATHPRTAWASALLARVLSRGGSAAEARTVAASAHEALATALTEDHWRTAVAASAEGEALVALERYADAEPLLVNSYAVLSQDPSATAIFVNDTAEALAAVYRGLNDPAKAAQYLALSSEE